MATERERRERGERPKPVPLPKKKPLTKKELEARPAPKKRPKRSRSQAVKKGNKTRKQRIPKERLEQLAAAREKMFKDKADNKLIQVVLKTFHIFGEKRFGPGVSYVPQCLLLAVLEQDRHAVESEDQLFVERTRIILKGQGATATIQVAPQNFQNVWAGNNPPIFDQVSGRGVVNGEGARF